MMKGTILKSLLLKHRDSKYTHQHDQLGAQGEVWEIILMRQKLSILHSEHYISYTHPIHENSDLVKFTHRGEQSQTYRNSPFF